MLQFICLFIVGYSIGKIGKELGWSLTKQLIITALAAIFVTLFSAPAKADFNLMQLDSVYINSKHYFPNSHSPFMTDGSVLNKGLDLHLDSTVLKYAYSKQMVWSLWDQHQVRWIGLNSKFGIRLLPFLDIEYEHFSKHVLDREYPYAYTGNRFPVEDSIGINLYLYRRDKVDTIIR